MVLYIYAAWQQIRYFGCALKVIIYVQREHKTSRGTIFLMNDITHALVW